MSMDADLGLVRFPCICTMSYYYATRGMEFTGTSDKGWYSWLTETVQHNVPIFSRVLAIAMYERVPWSVGVRSH